MHSRDRRVASRSRSDMAREYEAYYRDRSVREEAEEIAMLQEMAPLDQEAYALIEEEEASQSSP